MRMKASELVDILQKIIDSKGDSEVNILSRSELNKAKLKQYRIELVYHNDGKILIATENKSI